MKPWSVNIFGVALLLILSVVACDCTIEGRRSYGHWVGSRGVLFIDETAYGLSGQDKEELDTSVAMFYLVQEEYFLSNILSIPYSHTEVHIRDDYIPCRIEEYNCRSCSAVGYMSNGGPFIYISNIDECSANYLVQQQLDRLIPESLDYDYREFNLVENDCGAQISRCALARRRLERTTVYEDYCNE